MQQIVLQLYGTLGCHLCEQAKALLIDSLPASSYTLEEPDISESAELMSLYVLRIPVLYRDDLQLELDWPFDADILQAFMAADA
ncbi:glutaredoxin family protein [Dasania marina]|uniref:glutaredoxin family protein n=1 Tax=Dasania marina TaxID=471499 RepID=UPI0003689DBA|nr:glutaredoxin family protein [Dasania marina]